MSRAVKTLKRLQSKPTDFTWGEMVSLMESFGYELKTTGGSGRKFVHPATGASLMMHEPHKPTIVKAYVIRNTITFLKQEKHL